MEEIYSSSEDCYELVRLLVSKLKNKISIYGSPTNPLINGKYYGLSENGYYGSYTTTQKGLVFYAKYKKDGFLRIQIGHSYVRKASYGEKLAALSDICMALKDKYGTPDVFYTTKDDDEEALSLQWSYKDKEETHERLEYGEYFDDAEVDKLIFMDSTKKIGEDELSEKVGLPCELYDLVRENVDEFVKYKNGIEKEDCLKLTKKPNQEKK